MTAAKHLRAEAEAAGLEMPAEFLLRVMRSKRYPIEVRLNAAKAAAPYFHRALKSIEHSGEGGGPVQITWLDPNE